MMVGIGRRRRQRENETDERSEEDDDTTTESTGSNTTDDYESDEKTINEEVETWVEWIRRATFIAEESLWKAGLDNWVGAQRRRKFRWAGHVARRMDGRWSSIVVNWTPGVGSRRVGRPAMRLTDTLVQYFSYLGI